MGINLITATQTIAPAMGRTVLATLKKERKHEGLPTDDPGYKETLNLVRELIHFTAISAVEDIQHLTTGWVPHPPSAIVTDVEIPNRFYDISARHIQSNLGPKNLDLIGKTWWQWRRPNSVVRAEWVEMKADYLERKANNDPGKKVMFYIHGGAYFFGGIAHSPQIQRHARKLKGRVFAPRYRLAPHFPFPCAVQDILSAYLYLLTIEDPTSIVIAGDSAGGGLCMALLLILRDEGLPLPAGASLISPWVDLTHSFPSITIPTDLDYVPSHGFHSKPSLSWPPPTVEEMKILNWPVHPGAGPDFEMEIKGEKVALKDQIQLYAQNNHLQIPLVSPICAASLGGLCPLQVIVGGGEVLRDEQIYLAHKAANPSQYPPSDELLERNGNTMDDVTKYSPTDVQLLIFEGCPHAAPTLGHTRGAKYQYRSISQFAAWALAKAQGEDIEIDDSASIDSFWDSSSPTSGEASIDVGQVGKAGDPLPQFQDHMIRLHVNRFGKLFPLKPASELRACTFPREEVGWPKASALKGWMKYNDAASKKFASQKQKVWEQRLKYSKIGYINDFPNGEVPPPTALAGRRVIGQEIEREKPRGKMGKGIVGLFFGKLQHEPKIPRQDSLKLADAPKRKSKRVSYMPPPVAKDPHDQLPPIPQEDYREFLSEDLPEDLPEQQQEKPQQDVQADLQEMGVVHAASNDIRKIRVITGNFELPIASTFTSDEKDYGVDSAISVSPRL